MYCKDSVGFSQGAHAAGTVFKPIWIHFGRCFHSVVVGQAWSFLGLNGFQELEVGNVYIVYFSTSCHFHIALLSHFPQSFENYYKSQHTQFLLNIKNYASFISKSLSIQLSQSGSGLQLKIYAQISIVLEFRFFFILSLKFLIFLFGLFSIHGPHFCICRTCSGLQAFSWANCEDFRNISEKNQENLNSLINIEITQVI